VKLLPVAEGSAGLYIQDKEEKGITPVIEYPCRWSYRIIGSDEKALRKAISECVEGTDHQVSLSKSSSTGRYISLNLDALVHSEEVRLKIYHFLAGQASVKIVL